MLKLDHVTKIFGQGADDRENPRHVALADLNLHVGDGEFWCILGPSGCGKTTLLNVVAGFEAATEGEINLDNRPIQGPGGNRVVVFQDANAALFPWLTARQNVEFGLKLQGVDQTRRHTIASRYLQMVGLADDQAKYPAQLSGGMRQRIQLARALATEPKILLMDEPFASLDADTRRRMHVELLDLWQQTRNTVIFVTHDVAEAIILADRIAVLTPGPGSTVKEVLSVSIPRPRDPGTPDFAHYYGRVQSLAYHGLDSANARS